MSYFTKRSARIVAGSLAGALALSVTPIMGLTGIASAADALPPLADPIGAGNFCENAPTTEPFTDVSATDPAIDEIICLVATELTKGTSATTYSPNLSITRRQMALFIKRTADLANELDTGTNIAPLPAYDGAPDFLDIAGESTEVKEAIGQLAQADIVQGTSATTYSPRANVSRRQMAAFINRLQDFLTGDPFTTTGDFFNDDAGDSGEANLNAVASVGIFQGDGAGNVDPGGDLTRRQMAFVLLRHLQVNFDAGDIDGAFAPSTNATLASDATDGTQTVTFDPNGTGIRSKTYTFSGLDDTKTYDVAMFPVNYGGGYEDSAVNTDGIWSFRDQDAPFDGLADDPCNTSDGQSEIVSINGVAVNSACEYNVSPEGGALEIRLENFSDEADSAYLVAWAGATNNDLNLDDADLPSEAFGAIGPILWTGGECVTGDDVYGDILLLDQVAKSLVLDSADCTAFYDSADDYFYDYNIPISLAEFGSAVNNGDYIETEDLTTDDNYSRTSPNNWDLDDDNTGTPTAVTASAADSDSSATDTAANDVTVRWTHNPPLANMADDDNGYAGYCITRWSTTFVNQGTDCFYYSGGATSDAVVNNRTAILEDVPAGAWRYTVYAYSASDDSGDYSDPSAAVTTAVASGAPKSIATTSGDTDLSGTINSGDVLTVKFDQTMNNTVTGDSITVRDGDGTVCSITDVTNATVTYTTTTLTNDTLNILLTGAPVCTSAGTIGGLQYNATVTTSNNIIDNDQSLGWNISGSSDVLFE